MSVRPLGTCRRGHSSRGGTSSQGVALKDHWDHPELRPGGRGRRGRGIRESCDPREGHTGAMCLQDSLTKGEGGDKPVQLPWRCGGRSKGALEGSQNPGVLWVELRAGSAEWGQG